MSDFDQYKTIKAPSEGFFKDRGSKFYSFVYPIQNEDEFKENIQELKKRFHDARHHVYAFRIGPEKKIFRASDDGEPSNSSGPPILGQIQSFELTNVMVVVVRYFGGTKLGIPGLINAYKSAAADAINNATIIELTENRIIRVGFEYADMNKVMRIIKDEDIELTMQDFQLSCKLEVSVRLKNAERVKDRFIEAGNIQAEFVELS